LAFLLLLLFNKNPNSTHFPHKENQHFEASVGRDWDPDDDFIPLLYCIQITVKRSLFFFTAPAYILFFSISLDYSCLTIANVPCWIISLLFPINCLSEL